MSSPPFTVQADYAYQSAEVDDLKFDEGQLITVETIEDDDWYYGSYTDASGQKQSGIFPQNFVHAYTAPKHVAAGRKPPPTPLPAVAAPEQTSPVSPPAAPEQVSSPELSPAPVPVPAPSAPSAAAAAPPTSQVAAGSPPASQFSSSPPSQPSSAASGEPKPARKKNAFADRIAAFNDASQAPLSPFSAPKPASFVRKPFVPSPSNSYVPQFPTSGPPSSHVTASQQAHSQPPPEHVVHGDDPEEEDEDDKPIVSLQERIRLLQKQQEEERARMAASASKKKTKSRPKQTEASEEGAEGASAPLEPVTSAGSVQSYPSASIDAAHTGGSFDSVSDPSASFEHPPIPPQFTPQSRRSVDGRSMDGQHDSPIATVPEEEEPNEDEDNEDDGDESEEEEDDEEARRIALRNRMAKISGGMGMVGMMGGFGLPGAMPPAPKPKKTKKSAEEEDHPEVRQAPVPMVPFADPSAVSGLNLGYPKPNTHENEADDDDDDDDDNDNDNDNEDDKAADTNFSQGPTPIPPQHAPIPSQVAPPPAEHPTAPAVPPTPSSAPVPPPVAQRPQPPQPPRSVPAPNLPPQPPVRADLNSVIDAYRSDSENEESEGDWGDDNNPPQRATHAVPPPPPPTAGAPAAAAPPLPPVHAAPPPVPAHGSVPPPPIPTSPPVPSRSGSIALPDINTSPIISYADDDATSVGSQSAERSRSGKAKRDSVSLGSTRKSLEYDEIAEEALGDDENTESEDSRRQLPAPKVNTYRNSYIAGSGTIPPIPTSPLSTENGGAAGFNPRGPPPPPSGTSAPAVPSPGIRRVDSTGPISPSGPAPPPPSSQAPALPSRRLASETPVGYSSEETTGYEADEDTDANRSAFSNNTSFTDSQHLASPSIQAPPPPVPGIARSLSLSHRESNRPSYAHHSQSQSYSQSPRAPPPPPPTGAAPQPLQQQFSGPSQKINSPQVVSRDNALQSTSSQPIKSPDAADSSGRFGFRRASTDLTRTASKRMSQYHPGPPPQPVEELPYTIDLTSEKGAWWATKEGVPESLLKRKDVRYEIDSHELFKRNNLVIVVRDIYVLFADYSQEVITVEYNPQNPTGSAQVFKSKINSPGAPNQGDLEAAHRLYGKGVLDVVGRNPTHGLISGSNEGYVSGILKQVSGALPSIGNLAYGAQIYVNKDNGYIRQYDEVKPGDIITFKGAKFQGHKGSLHQKYSSEAGRNDVINSGVIYEYDATKRKVRVYMSDESAPGKIKSDGFRLNDLKVGEIKVFRIVGREYVGW